MVDICKICEHPHERACNKCPHQCVKSVGRRDKEGRLIIASGEDVPHFAEEEDYVES
jgi:hypothetical protein